MKKLKTNMDKWFERLDKQWCLLPRHQQHRYTLYFFTGYLILTAGVIFKVWHDTATSGNSMNIEHIKNPVFKKTQRPAIPAGHIENNAKK